jgi:hypothetical protein
MDAANLRVLQAASRVLNEKNPAHNQVSILKEFAKEEIPERSDLPPDELATVVALKLMGITDGSRLP